MKHVYGPKIIYFETLPWILLFLIYFLLLMCVCMCVCVCAHTNSFQSCPTLCHTMDYSLPGFSWDSGLGCHTLFQRSSWLRVQTHVPYISCIGRQDLCHYCHLRNSLLCIYLHILMYFLPLVLLHIENVLTIKKFCRIFQKTIVLKLYI